MIRKVFFAAALALASTAQAGQVTIQTPSTLHVVTGSWDMQTLAGYGSFYVFGTGAGWHGWMPLGERLKVLAMWRLVLPLLTWWKGYCPWKLLGLGEDLPRDVFRQWRHWCGFRRYFFDDPAMQGIDASYARIRAPMVAANATDDLWALPASRDAFVWAYANAALTRRDIDPNAYAGQIGHMGYFRSQAQPLWDETLDWFSQLAAAPERAAA